MPVRFAVKVATVGASCGFRTTQLAAQRHMTGAEEPIVVILVEWVDARRILGGAALRTRLACLASFTMVAVSHLVCKVLATWLGGVAAAALAVWVVVRPGSLVGCTDCLCDTKLAAPSAFLSALHLFLASVAHDDLVGRRLDTRNVVHHRVGAHRAAEKQRILANTTEKRGVLQESGAVVAHRVMHCKASAA